MFRKGINRLLYECLCNDQVKSSFVTHDALHLMYGLIEIKSCITFKSNADEQTLNLVLNF